MIKEKCKICIFHTPSAVGYIEEEECCSMKNRCDGPCDDFDPRIKHMNDYQVWAGKTAAYEEDRIAARIKMLPQGLIHSVLGLQDEVGELAKQIKAHIFYGTELDHVNIVEELGDILWYLSEGARSIGIRLEKVASRNIRKLGKRYENGFTESEAVERDLEAERSVLNDFYFDDRR